MNAIRRSHHAAFLVLRCDGPELGGSCGGFGTLDRLRDCSLYVAESFERCDGRVTRVGISVFGRDEKHPPAANVLAVRIPESASASGARWTSMSLDSNALRVTYDPRLVVEFRADSAAGLPVVYSVERIRPPREGVE